MRSSILVLLSLAAVSCGPATVTPKADVTGNLGGQSVGTLEAYLGEVVSGRGRVDLLVIGLTTATSACEKAKANQVPKDTTTVLLSLQNDRGDSLKAGTYPIITGNPTGSSGNYARGRVTKFDASCVDGYAGDAGLVTAGKVTLTNYAEGGSVSGSFELTVGNDSLTGTFAANTCAGLDQAMVDTADTCQ